MKIQRILIGALCALALSGCTRAVEQMKSATWAEVVGTLGGAALGGAAGAQFGGGLGQTIFMATGALVGVALAIRRPVHSVQWTWQSTRKLRRRRSLLRRTARFIAGPIRKPGAAGSFVPSRLINARTARNAGNTAHLLCLMMVSRRQEAQPVSNRMVPGWLTTTSSNEDEYRRRQCIAIA